MARNSTTLRCAKCRPKWRRAKSKAATRRRRQGMVFVEQVDVWELYRRDGGVCQLCRKKVSLRAKANGPWSASIDHIVPVSQGGEHSYRNTQLAHLRCNVCKCVNAMGEQLRLVG